MASVVLHHKMLVQDRQLLLSIPDAALSPVIIARNTEEEEEEEGEGEGEGDDKLRPRTSHIAPWQSLSNSA